MNVWTTNSVKSFETPDFPKPEEVRRLALQTNWSGALAIASTSLACGERFWMLEARNLEEGNWHASAYGVDKIEGSCGSSPDEAVARLWLALNKN